MPYNTAPIKPSDAVTGTSSLPCQSPCFVVIFIERSSAKILAVARIKKIISMDEDIAACSNNAAFAISVATVGRCVCGERLPTKSLFRSFSSGI